MFLHLGGDVVVPIEDIIAIIDVSSIMKSKDSKEFFRIAEEEGFVRRITKEEPKACIITEKMEKKNKGTEKIIKTAIYYSSISSITLQKRAGFVKHIDCCNEIHME